MSLNLWRGEPRLLPAESERHSKRMKPCETLGNVKKVGEGKFERMDKVCVQQTSNLLGVN